MRTRLELERDSPLSHWALTQKAALRRVRTLALHYRAIRLFDLILFARKNCSPGPEHQHAKSAEHQKADPPAEMQRLVEDQLIQHSQALGRVEPGGGAHMKTDAQKLKNGEERKDHLEDYIIKI